MRACTGYDWIILANRSRDSGAPDWLKTSRHGAGAEGIGGIELGGRVGIAEGFIDGSADSTAIGDGLASPASCGEGMHPARMAVRMSRAIRKLGFI
jgi:hypothetical protein